MRSLIDIMELSTDEIEELINTALDIIDKPEKYNEVLPSASSRRCSSSPRPVPV